VTVLTQHTIRIAEDRLTRSQLKYLRILSCKNDQFNTVCHQANRQLHARLLDFTQYIRYKPVLQLEELITAMPLVSWFLCMKCLQAGLLYFYGEACLHLSGCINSPKEYKHGVLQTHVNCMIILCIRQNRFSVHSISKKNCGTIVLRRDSYSRKKLKSFDSIH